MRHSAAAEKKQTIAEMQLVPDRDLLAQRTAVTRHSKRSIFTEQYCEAYESIHAGDLEGVESAGAVAGCSSNTHA